MHISKLLFLFLFLPLFVLADTCHSVNLVSREGSPFNHIPVVNQGKVNICYAYSAAHMMDYHLLKNGSPKVSVHPVWIALNYALKKNKDGLEIGHPKEAIESLAEAQNCDYETVKFSLNQWGGKLTGPMRPLYEALKSACTGQALRQVNVPKVGQYYSHTLLNDASYTSFISSRLDDQDSPISISYCSNIWKDPDYQGIGQKSSSNKEKLKAGCHYHESLIVGKKPINGSCSFLVRNTWGTNWTTDNRNWQCLCRNKNSGELVDDCRSSTHEMENYAVEACWLPAEKLARNIGRVTVIE